MYEPPIAIPSVRELIRRVDVTVAGLPQQKARLAVVIHRHAMSCWNQRDYAPINPIVLGPTGGGKSYLAHALLEASGLPFIEINATQYSEVGYTGLDLSSIFLGFHDKYVATGERQQTLTPLVERWGVVILDEFDKWRVQVNLKERQPQRALQAELLKMLEGDTVYARKSDSVRGFAFETRHILFIALGAFEGLDGEMARRGDAVPNAYTRAQPFDIMQYGFLMELVGRFPEIIALPPLAVEPMVAILKQHFWPRFEQEARDIGVELVTDEPAMREIAGQAIGKRIGARGFPNTVNALLWKAWSKARPGDRIVVDVPAVLGNEARLESSVTANG